mgnify:CR=1 FL=1
MKKTNELIKLKMKYFEKSMEVLHTEGVNETCSYCWTPTINNYCSKCNCVSDIGNDTFITLTTESELTHA